MGCVAWEGLSSSPTFTFSVGCDFMGDGGGVNVRYRIKSAVLTCVSHLYRLLEM